MNIPIIENTTMVTDGTLLDWVTLDRIGIIIGIVVGVIALAISKRGILPDIEFRYEIKSYDPKKKVKDYLRYFYERHKEKYGNKYSHLTVFNGGNGKASNIDIGYNWEVDGRVGGVTSEVINKEGVDLIYEDYLFPGHEFVDVPAIDFGSDVFEEAKWIRIRVRYKDGMGGSHCKCVLFACDKEEREFDRIPLSYKYCGRVKRLFETIIQRCPFKEDVCSTEDLIQITEDEREEFFER